MWIMAAILYFIFVGVVAIANLTILLPLIIGIFLFFVAFCICRNSQCGRVPILWTVYATADAIRCSILIAKDIFDSNNLDIPSLLAKYAITAAVLMFVCLAWKIARKKAAAYDPSNKAEKGITYDKKIVASLMPAERHLHIVQESVDLLSRTTNPDTFFGRYHDALLHSQQAASDLDYYGGGKDAAEVAQALEAEKEDLIDEFLARCYEAGKLPSLHAKLLTYRDEMTVANLQYLSDLLSDENDSDPDDADIDTRKLCEKLKKQISVDFACWQKWQLDFHCNLVSDDGALQLNFEVKNTSGKPWRSNGSDIIIKANIYDANKNLLTMDETEVSAWELQQGRYSDYLYFYCDDLQKASSMEIYAYMTN